jgi:hypothetical protein
MTASAWRSLSEPGQNLLRGDLGTQHLSATWRAIGSLWDASYTRPIPPSPSSRWTTKGRSPDRGSGPAHRRPGRRPGRAAREPVPVPPADPRRRRGAPRVRRPGSDPPPGPRQTRRCRTQGPHPPAHGTAPEAARNRSRPWSLMSVTARGETLSPTTGARTASRVRRSGSRHRAPGRSGDGGAPEDAQADDFGVPRLRAARARPESPELLDLHGFAESSPDMVTRRKSPPRRCPASPLVVRSWPG